MFEQCQWFNEPSTWSLEGDTLEVTTDPKTDFWRNTHYGFTRDSGHCFGARTAISPHRCACAANFMRYTIRRG